MHDLTEEQQAVYDRQLRVWGMEAQKRMNSTRLIIAGLGGLGAEVAKNLTLAGVGHVTVLDAHTYDGEHVNGNFLVPSSTPRGQSVAEATAASLQEMNPFIEVKGLTGRLGDANHGADFVAKFDLVIVIGYSLQDAVQVDRWCTQASTPTRQVQFFYARPRGPACFLFANMGPRHVWHPTAKVENATAPPQENADDFCSLEHALTGCAVEKTFDRRTPELAFCVYAAAQAELASGQALSPAALPAAQSALQDLQGKLTLKRTFSPEMLEAWVTQDYDFAPVAAICGGILGQEVVRAISCKGPVFRNTLFYHLVDGQGKVVPMGVEKKAM